MCFTIRTWQFLPWQHTGFQTSPILKAFLTTFGFSFQYLKMERSFWRFISLTMIVLKARSCEQRNATSTFVFCRERFYPHKPHFRATFFARPRVTALFMYLIWYWVECMTSSFISFAYFTDFSNFLCVYLQTVNGVFVLSWNSLWYTQKIKG